MVELKLKQYNSLSGPRLLEPANPKQISIFMHCTGGSIAVTEKAFFDEYMAVFQMHGVECLLPTDFVLSMRPTVREGEEAK